MGDDRVLTPPTPREIRAELEGLVVGDLYGPVGGDEHEQFSTSERVTDRYILGRLAPDGALIDPDAPFPAAQAVTSVPVRPPDLIVQDELHLITGPIGSLAGLYETAVDLLAGWNHLDPRTGTSHKVRPKVRAAEQVDQRLDLWHDRRSRQTAYGVGLAYRPSQHPIHAVGLLSTPEEGRWRPTTAPNSLREVEPGIRLVLDPSDTLGDAAARPFTPPAGEGQDQP